MQSLEKLEQFIGKHKLPDVDGVTVKIINGGKFILVYIRMLKHHGRSSRQSLEERGGPCFELCIKSAGSCFPEEKPVSDLYIPVE